jgi:hypothetical protein
MRIVFFASLKSLKKGVGSGVGPGSGSVSQSIDPRIRIRSKNVTDLPTQVFLNHDYSSSLLFRTTI